MTLSTLPAVLKDALVGVAPGQLTPVVQFHRIAILKVVDDADPANINMNAVNPASLATAANVKYVIDVSGIVEAEAILQAFPKPADWNQIRARSARRAANLWHRRRGRSKISCRVRGWMDVVAIAVRHHAAPSRWLSSTRMTAGWIARSLEYQRAFETARLGVPAAAARMIEALGVAHLHKAGRRTAPIAHQGTSACYRSPGSVVRERPNTRKEPSSTS